MCELEKKMLAAVENCYCWQSGNTMVTGEGSAIEVYLHGHKTWRKSKKTGVVFWTLAGHNTPTTRRRLNALGVPVTTRNGVPYVGANSVDVSAWNKL